MLRLGELFPDFKCETTKGSIPSFRQWIEKSWVVLFSHPRDFTPVCTTELGRAMSLTPEFEKRGVKLIAVSCDTLNDHLDWSKDILQYTKEKHPECQCSGDSVPFPIIDDSQREIIKLLGMQDPDETDNDIPLPARAAFIIGPDGKLKASILYPATTGRNFVEILRVVDSLQLTMGKSVATPVDWKVGDKVVVHPAIKNEDLPKHNFTDVSRPIALPSGKDYLRYTNY